VKNEEGIDGLDGARFPTANTFGEVLEGLATLATEKHDYQTYVLDSVSALEPLIWAETCALNGNAASIEKVNGGFGKGYIEALKCWSDLLAGLDHLRTAHNMTVILIGHTKVKPFNDPLADPYDAYIIDLQERASALLFRWADCILFAGRKPTVKNIVGKGDSVTTHGIGGDKSICFTRKRAGIPAGGRGVYGQLPPEIPLTWQAFADAVAAASVK
jgi:hypothetical protein